ncbi:glycosyltransferase family 87 protein [Gordonia sp. CPCC 205333]|uniref:glycosyltransferase family 87 protein n=1 Tax=Gordonia sp. CPCC 205333 TaxID=3140790 RepID=UPI003AF339B0
MIDASEQVSPDDVESPGPLAADSRVDVDRESPSTVDPLVGPASSVIGGPLGRHAVVGREKFLTPIRVLFALALLGLALGWFGKAGCLQQAPVDAASSTPSRTAEGGFDLDWKNQRQFFALCYSDIVPLYGNERLDTGGFPYRTYWVGKDTSGKEVKQYMEYPVLTGAYMYGVAKFTHWWQLGHDKWGLPSALSAVMFFNFTALGLALFWLITIWATGRTARTRIWAPWLAALSPLVIVHVFTNFDAIPIAMVALAMLAWTRFERDQNSWTPWVAGACVGLGVSSNWYPVLLLVAIGVLCARSRQVRPFLAAAAGAIAAWMAVNTAVLILYPTGWSEYFRYDLARSAESDSLFGVVRDLAGFTWNTGVLNGLSLFLLVMAIVGVVIVGVVAPRPPSLAQLMFLLVAAYLLTNKVWSPQYSLWLVPLAVLAIPRTRLLIAWMVIDALIWVPRMSLYLDADRMWLTSQWFTLAVLIRTAMVIALCVVVITDILQLNTGRLKSWVPDGGKLDFAKAR